MTTSFFSDVFKSGSKYLNPIGTAEDDSFLHLAVDIRNCVYQKDKRGIKFSQLESEFDHYKKINGVIAQRSAFEMLETLKKNIIEKDREQRSHPTKFDRKNMPQIIPPPPKVINLKYADKINNFNFFIEQMLSDRYLTFYKPNIMWDDFKAILRGTTNIPELLNNNEIDDYIKRIYYLNKNKIIFDNMCKKPLYSSNKDNISCKFFKTPPSFEILKSLDFAKMNDLSLAINSEIVQAQQKTSDYTSANEPVSSPNSVLEVDIKSLIGAQTDISVYKCFNIALGYLEDNQPEQVITFDNDGDSYNGKAKVKAYDKLNIKSSITLSQQLKIIIDNTLPNPVIIDGHHNWAANLILWYIFDKTPKDIYIHGLLEKIEVSKKDISFDDYYKYAMAHPLVFCIDYNDNFVQRDVELSLQRDVELSDIKSKLSGGGRRRYKKKSRQRGGKRSRKANRSNKSVRKVKGRKTKKFGKRKVTLKNMSPRLLEAFGTLNR